MRRPTSVLIGCDRFKGFHTAERNTEAFHVVCAEYNLVGKITHIITDHVDNTRKAFKVTLPISSMMTKNSSLKYKMKTYGKRYQRKTVLT